MVSKSLSGYMSQGRADTRGFALLYTLGHDLGVRVYLSTQDTQAPVRRSVIPLDGWTVKLVLTDGVAQWLGFRPENAGS